MPNIDFYAAGKDFGLVLDYVFSKSACRIFESYSPYGAHIAEFGSLNSVAARYGIGQCVGDGSSVYLTLVPRDMMHLCHVRRIELNPEKCDGHTFRYGISGWGVITLHLGGLGPKGLVVSHSNHNTPARAKSWEHIYKDELGPADAWDWEVTAKISAALNRFIRTKLALYKLGSRPVLPDAAEAFQSGARPVVRRDADLLEQMIEESFSVAGAT